MNTGCEFHADALVDHAAGRLAGERARRLEEHLAGCAECRESLAVILAVRSAPLPVPDGLESRIRTAVRTTPTSDRPARAVDEPRTVGAPFRWRPWALPLAAAAALAVVWVGIGDIGWPGGAGDDPIVVPEDYEPYGTWPAADGIVAGDPLLSELSVEDLERLLEEMDS